MNCKLCRKGQKVLNSNFPQKSLTPILVLFDCEVWSRKKEEGQIYETVLVRFCDLLATLVFILCKSRSKPNLFCYILEFKIFLFFSRAFQLEDLYLKTLKILIFWKRNWVFATNYKFLISISLQPSWSNVIDISSLDYLV